MESSAAPAPAATRNSMNEKPKTMPRTCGRPRRTPTLAPVAVTMMLFGPGVMEVTIAKTRKAATCSRLIASPDRSGELTFYAGWPLSGNASA